MAFCYCAMCLGSLWFIFYDGVFMLRLYLDYLGSQMAQGESYWSRYVSLHSRFWSVCNISYVH